MSLKMILSPVKIGSVTIPNRVVRTAHVTNWCVGGVIPDRWIAYHEERARGGVGLTVLEAGSVHPSSIFHPNMLILFDDRVIEVYRRLMEKIRAYPMRVFQQLWHGGHNAFQADGSPPWSASALPGLLHGVPATEMTKAQIDEVVAAYAAAAKRGVEGGLHGCEVTSAHGYLPAQFLASATNSRTDEYGGSFDNRLRFLAKVLSAIRDTVPQSYALGVRIGPELVEGGISIAEVQEIILALERDKLVDYFSFSLGNYSVLPKIAAALQEPSGYELKWNSEFAKHTKLPVMVTGRFRTLEEADQPIANGQAALVGMTRAHIADPDIVRKTVEGHPEQVRPCIGCNQMCIGGMFGPTGEVRCTVNPAMGQELTRSEDKIPRTADPKKVLVVGGGVGGMEAARVAALRGHKVTLAEAQPKVGGVVRLAASRTPKLLGLGDITYWLEQEMERLGVEVRNNTFVEAADVIAERPDAVIVATGSSARLDGIQLARPGHRVAGVHKAHVRSSLDTLLLPKVSLGKRAVVLDDVGHYEGIAVSEYLASQGISVTYVTRHVSFAPLMEPSLRAEPALARLEQYDFDLRTRAFLSEIRDDAVVIEDLPSGEPETIPADLVVLVTFNAPVNNLSGELAGYAGRVICIGDAKSPRFMHTAIHEGNEAGFSV